jgi:hypothetical protein
MATSVLNGYGGDFALRDQGDCLLRALLGHPAGYERFKRFPVDGLLVLDISFAQSGLANDLVGGIVLALDLGEAGVFCGLYGVLFGSNASLLGALFRRQAVGFGLFCSQLCLFGLKLELATLKFGCRLSVCCGFLSCALGVGGTVDQLLLPAGGGLSFSLGTLLGFTQGSLFGFLCDTSLTLLLFAQFIFSAAASQLCLIGFELPASREGGT